MLQEKAKGMKNQLVVAVEDADGCDAPYCAPELAADQ